MKMQAYRNGIYSALFVAVVTLGLSFFADVAYIFSLFGLSGWAAFGLLITLDDDMPGEWSNPERSPKIWRRSLIEFAVKFFIFILLVALVFTFPSLKKYGA